MQMDLKGDPLEGMGMEQGKADLDNPLALPDRRDAPEHDIPIQPTAGEPCLDPGGDFSQDQKEDPTLSQVYEQMVYINGAATDPWLAAQWPWFEFTQDQLRHVYHDPRTRKFRSQLVVTRC